MPFPIGLQFNNVKPTPKLYIKTVENTEINEYKINKLKNKKLSKTNKKKKQKTLKINKN